ncbi:MAG: hypothetical protein M1836_005997 [Candelina mexicana]|nr:MAG: hypothetical protein M1836_005997 [Candelina mexicana]
MASKTSSLPLLSLPRELRDHIYSYLLLLSSAPAPKSPDDAGRRQENPCDIIPPHCAAVHYQLPTLRSPISALLCTSHQVHDEAHAAIIHHSKTHPDGLRSYLDCMIEGVNLWPTWLSLQAPAQYVRHITVDIRCFGDPNKIRFRSNLGITPIARQLLKLLWMYFANGPKFLGGELRPRQRPQSCKNTLDSLTLNYVPQSRDYLRASGEDGNWAEEEDFEYTESNDTSDLEIVVGRLISMPWLKDLVRRLRLTIFGVTVIDRHIQTSETAKPP